MYYSDFHMHTQRSDDSHATLDEECKQAIKMGMREICITDHWNLVSQNGQPLPHSYDFAPTQQMATQANAKYFGQLEVRMGIEVGNGNIDEAAVEAQIQYPGLDFVIGSLHNNSEKFGNMGTYTLARQAKSVEECHRYMVDYMDLMLRLAATGGYDVLGHILYPIRYFPREFDVKLASYWDHVEAILKAVIAQGKGIEVNTSQGSTIEDWREILELYRSLGGEVLTTGADAHFNEKVGAGIKEATALIGQMGFQYTSTFRGRTPCFHRI